MIPILFFSSYGSLTRGGQKSLWYILRDLDRTLYRPVLLCQEEGDLTRKAAELKIPVEILRVPLLRPAGLFLVLSFVRRLFALARKYGIKIVHSEELKINLFLSPLRLFGGLKTIWHVRVLWDTPFQKRISLLVCDRIVCVSRAVAASFSGFLWSHKVVVIPNGIDAWEFYPSAGGFSLPEEDKTPLVGCIGSILEHKGLHVLIEAAAMAMQKGPPFKLILVGGGEKSYIDRLKVLAANLKIGGRVVFWGEEADPRGLMGRMAVIAMPSLSGEGLSRSLLEAMAMAKPIVASGLPQNAELITDGETGLLSETGSAADLSRQLLRLLENRKLAEKLGQNARKYVVEHHGLAATMAGIHSLFAVFSKK